MTDQRMRNTFGRTLPLLLASLPLSGCSWMLAGAQDVMLGPTLRSGLESFSIAADLPADFALEIRTGYDGDASSACQYRSLDNGQMLTRGSGEDYLIDFQDAPHTGAVRIPLHYRKGLCRMRLTSVDFLVYGRYGRQDWQRTYAHGGLVLVRKLPKGAPGFQADGTLSKQAQCAWMFQVSRLYLQLSKLLTCKNAGAYVLRDELPGKTLKFQFTVSPEEEPYHDQTWIKFPEGWKPCAEEKTDKGTWRWCRNPPTFRTFQMNGRTCTVYPNCTE